MKTPYPPIEKKRPFRLAPNIADYERACAEFSWARAESLLSGLPGGKWNIAHEAIDRHVAAGLAERTAIRWLGRTGAIREYSYAGLAELTSRFASGLRRLGVGRGDRVRKALACRR
jgi:acetyl-CoA synthetase